MEQVFGPVTPFMILMLLMLATEWIKRSFQALTGRQVQLIALGLSIIFVVLYQTFTAWPDLTPIGVFASFVYAFLGWFATIGMYEVATKQLKRDE